MHCETAYPLKARPFKGLPVTLFDPTEVFGSVEHFPRVPLLRSIDVVMVETFIVGAQKTAATFGPLLADVSWK